MKNEKKKKIRLLRNSLRKIAYEDRNPDDVEEICSRSDSETLTLINSEVENDVYDVFDR